MGDTKQDMLDAAKTLLNIKDMESDTVLLLLIDETIDAVLAYCHIEFMPRQLMSFIPTVVAKRFVSLSGGTVKAITEGERRVEYTDGKYDFLTDYAKRLRPFVSREAWLPSQVEDKENG